MKVGEPVWQDLESPRDLSADERRLITKLVAAVSEPLLHRQVTTATVASVCRCGCSSVRLHSDEPSIPEARVVQLSGRDHPDYSCVDSVAVSHAAELDDVQVVLHVIQGRIQELEVFAGEGVAVSLASLTDLTDVTVA